MNTHEIASSLNGNNGEETNTDCFDRRLVNPRFCRNCNGAPCYIAECRHFQHYHRAARHPAAARIAAAANAARVARGEIVRPVSRADLHVCTIDCDHTTVLFHLPREEPSNSVDAIAQAIQDDNERALGEQDALDDLDDDPSADDESIDDSSSNSSMHDSIIDVFDDFDEGENRRPEVQAEIDALQRERMIENMRINNIMLDDDLMPIQIQPLNLEPAIAEDLLLDREAHEVVNVESDLISEQLQGELRIAQRPLRNAVNLQILQHNQKRLHDVLMGEIPHQRRYPIISPLHADIHRGVVLHHVPVPPDTPPWFETIDAIVWSNKNTLEIMTNALCIKNYFAEGYREFLIRWFGYKVPDIQRDPLREQCQQSIVRTEQTNTAYYRPIWAWLRRALRLNTKFMDVDLPAEHRTLITEDLTDGLYDTSRPCKIFTVLAEHLLAEKAAMATNIRFTQEKESFSFITYCYPALLDATKQYCKKYFLCEHFETTTNTIVWVMNLMVTRSRYFATTENKPISSTATRHYRNQYENLTQGSNFQ